MCVYGEVLQSLYPMGHKQTPPLYCLRTGSDMLSPRMSLIPAGRVSLLEGNEPMVTHTCWHVLVHRALRISYQQTGWFVPLSLARNIAQMQM